MKLLIVESPSKAKTINQYLGKEFDVTSSYGHIRGLPSENGSVDPDKDFAMRYEILERSQVRVNDIVKKLQKCDEIYLATDPDREGEAISWHILEALKECNAIKPNMPIKRVVFYEITKKAVQAAIANPRDIDIDLVRAQQARQALDYLVGFQLSPILWRKLPGCKSAGRVQSVALRIVCERENEIDQFNEQEYWSINASFTAKDMPFNAHLTHYNGDKLDKFDVNNQEQASKLQAEFLKYKYSVAKVDKRKLNRSPYAPFTTSTMLQEASKKLGFSAKKTSKLAQDLYEGMNIEGTTVGLITYMRTDSVHVSTDAVAAAREQIGKEFGDKYLPSSARQYKTKTKNAQEAHEAIRPTDVAYTPDRVRGYLENDHLRLYDLIWKRLIASQMENALFNTVSVDIADENKVSTFRASGSTLVFDGYLRAYQETDEDSDDEDKQRLPEMEEGLALALIGVEPKQHFTQPPPRYTEASLVKKMEELGIGRPSTYPAIISLLQEREYVKVDKKRFYPESKGRVVNAFLTSFFNTYFEYDFTAKMEDQLDQVSNGEDDWKKVLREFWTPFHASIELVAQIRTSEIIEKMQILLERFIFNNVPADENGKHKCPSCDTGVLGLKMGKFGAFIGCSNYPECKHIQNLAIKIGGTDNTDTIINDGQVAEFPKIIGTDGDYEISLRKGPYGLYIQKTKGDEIKRASLPGGTNLAQVDLEYALKLLSLPRVVGDHPEGGVVKAGFGRFGPYIEYNKKYSSIKDHNPLTISLETALHILSIPKPERKKKEVATVSKAKPKKAATKKAPAKKAVVKKAAVTKKSTKE